MCNRKYDKYIINVVMWDGSTETVEEKIYESKGDYESLRKRYHEVKEEYKTVAKEVRFEGTNDSGDYGIIHKKEFTNEELIENHIANIEVEDIVDMITQGVNKLQEKRDYSNSKYSLLTKERDTTLHKFLDMNDTDDNFEEEILNIGKILWKQTEERKREYDSYLKAENAINKAKKNIFDLNKDKLIKPYNPSKSNVRVNIETYKDEYERDCKINILINNYDNVIDMGDGNIKYYNKCRKSKHEQTRGKTLVDITPIKDENGFYIINKDKNKPDKIIKDIGSSSRVYYRNEAQRKNYEEYMANKYSNMIVKDEYIDFINRIKK